MVVMIPGMGTDSALGLGFEPDDAVEVGLVEARASDEHAVDVGHRHEAVDVAGLHAAAVEDERVVRDRPA